MKICVAGVCTAGKTTLVNTLRKLGYQAYHVAQEHSYVARMWALRRPDFLVVLDCSYETSLKRRAVPWGVAYMEEQRRRLEDARVHCDLYLNTDDMGPGEVVDAVVAAVHKAQIGGSMMPIVNLDVVKKVPEIEIYINKGNDHLGAIGYTEHGPRHANLVANIAHNVLARLGFPQREAELAAIAGYLHDIGNIISRVGHGQAGATMAFTVLRELGMPHDEIAVVMGAIGSHDPEESGHPVNNVSAALILGDKSDVHRTRVRNPDQAAFDIHDRVNYAVEHSFLRVDDRGKTITLELKIDTKISPVMDYFEIFLTRMVMCRRAASFLGCDFGLAINDVRLL